MAYQDIILQCSDCGSDFTFTEGEQEFYATKGLSNQPKRCQTCRSNRKRVNNRFSQKRMYDVVCSECGIETQVPFRPSEDKPVFCKSCFENMKATV